MNKEIRLNKLCYLIRTNLFKILWEESEYYKKNWAIWPLRRGIFHSNAETYLKSNSHINFSEKLLMRFLKKKEAFWEIDLVYDKENLTNKPS